MPGDITFTLFRPLTIGNQIVDRVTLTAPSTKLLADLGDPFEAFR